MADPNDQQHSREELLRSTREQHDRLAAQIAALTDEQLTQPGVTDDWSVKDHLAHLTWWARRVIDMLGGAPDPIGELGLSEPSEDEINAQVRERSRKRSLTDVRADFEASYQDMLRLITTVSEESLASRYGWMSGNADSHYAEHAAMFEVWRARQQAQA